MWYFHTKIYAKVIGIVFRCPILYFLYASGDFFCQFFLEESVLTECAILRFRRTELILLLLTTNYSLIKRIVV